MPRTAEDIVRTEVHYCVSSLVSTLAQGPYLTFEMGKRSCDELFALTEQAFELASPVLDYEEAAIQEGWSLRNGALWHTGENMMFGGVDATGAPDWEALCVEHDIEPYDREVFEHWIVSDWLADKLAGKGEKVDKDFAGMTVWARTTTGQGIACDGVIEQIAAELNAA